MPDIVRKKRVLATPLLVVMLVFPVGVVLANSLPSLTLWLEFEYETSEQPELEGVQILRCESPECSHPNLLQGYGTCASEGCVDGAPSLRASQPLECRGDRCVAVLTYANEAIPPLKVVAQFSDRVRESDLFLDELPIYGTMAWRIAVQDTILTITATEPDPIDPMGIFSSRFFQHFALTLIVELLVAAAAFRGWLKLKERNLVSGLGYVLLANVISYPATWIFWPSLQQFQPMATRYVGYFVVSGALVFAGLLLILSRQEGKARRIWVIVTLVLLPLAVLATLACLLMASLGAGYGWGLVAVPGMPAGLTIALAEIFAISFEALILYLLARKTLELTFKQAATISLLANVSSFLAGLLLTGWL